MMEKNKVIDGKIYQINNPLNMLFIKSQNKNKKY